MRARSQRARVKPSPSNKRGTRRTENKKRRSTYCMQLLGPGGNLPRSVVPEGMRNPDRDIEIRDLPEAG
ncbi:hypothetical protein NDU88_007101 [Pleurodeles waltl]|uniref:Uncharacterized protein n=1 Tax=Pleurodeles waltl TaxID=8319 RepID=A0AAV7TZ14_PLEWA|nr:hypothetical protein NDU88_007101 [Pleurodeles waltl]